MLEELGLHIGENARQMHTGAKKQHKQHFKNYIKIMTKGECSLRIIQLYLFTQVWVSRVCVAEGECVFTRTD
jgi:hypothetical protein